MIFVNGAATDSVAALDRGLAYGDGVFRTLPVRRGKPQCWPLHFRKLAHDCAAIGIPCPPEAVLAAELGQLARESSDFAAKIIVTRGGGARGYAPPPSASPTRVVLSAGLPEYPAEFARAGIRAHLCATRLSSQPRLAGLKHLNRLENVLARAEWSDPAVAEGLVFDSEDHVVGGTMSNLFIVEGGALVTPELSRCGVAGVTRERIMNTAARQGIACRVESVPRARFFAAQEAMVVNSLIGAWQIRQCADRNWETGTVISRVREWLDAEMD
jgi:4-amino-4-deoxychorismate lyase